MRDDLLNKSQIFNARHVAEAANVGLEIIGLGRECSKFSYRTYRIIACGHEQNYATGDVRRGQFKCAACQTQKLTREATIAGLEIVGETRSSIYRNYRFISCGHEQEIATSVVRKNNFTCSICQREKIEQEANFNGLEIIGKAHDASYRNYRFINCGHSSMLHVGAVKKNQFTCQQCEETSRTKPSGVYLLRITSGAFTWLRFGYTKSVHSRISQYGLPDGAKVEILAICEFSTGNEAHTFENSIHKLHKKHKLCPETMKKYHKASGYNECYPTYMQATLETIILAEANNQLEE